MALPLPSLDDRRWTDLVDEGRGLVPRHAPDWTDHNIHDPGITLIELLAWLTETEIFRADRVPSRHLRKFLALCGLSAAGPRSAQVMLTAVVPPPVAPFTVPAGTTFEAGRRDRRPIAFATARVAHLGHVAIAALGRDDGSGAFVDLTRDLTDGLPVSLFGVDPQPGAAFYLGFDAVSVGAPVALAWWLDGAGHDWAARERIVDEAAAAHAFCLPVAPAIECPGSAALEAGWTPPLVHHSVRLTWETFTGATGWTPLEPATPPAVPLPGQVVDDTRALTLDGLVEFSLPPATAATTVGADPTPRVFVRCRLERGSYDRPVVMRAVRPNGMYASNAVPLWQDIAVAPGVIAANTPPAAGDPLSVHVVFDGAGRATALTFLSPGTGGAPAFRFFEYVAPTALSPGRLVIGAASIGTGAGRPGLVAPIPHSPVVAGTVAVWTHGAGAWDAWTPVADFDASTATDRHVTLDAVGGLVAFGDGNRGRVAPAAHAVVARASATDGADGDVPAARISRLSPDRPNDALLAALAPGARAVLAETVTNPFAARGGADVEPLSAPIRRAVEAVHAHEMLLQLADDHRQETLDQIPRDAVLSSPAPARAANTLDIERLALAVPGTHVARARALGATHPDYGCLRAEGVVTVVIVPHLPIRRPMPSAGLLRAVRRFLDRRRTICTRIETTGPRYVAIGAAAVLTRRPGADPAVVVRLATDALVRFFDPVGGGALGLGWPFGRAVYRADVLRLLDDVPGVDHVASLTLVADDGAAQCGDVALCPTALTTPGVFEVTVS